MVLGKRAHVHVNGPVPIDLNHIIIRISLAALGLLKLHFACTDKYFLFLMTHFNEIMILFYCMTLRM